MNSCGSNWVRKKFELVNQGRVVGAWTNDRVCRVAGRCDQVVAKVSFSQLFGLTVDLEKYSINSWEWDKYSDFRLFGIRIKGIFG